VKHIPVAVTVLLLSAGVTPALDEIERTMVEEIMRVTKVEQQMATTMDQMKKMVADQVQTLDLPESAKEHAVRAQKRMFDLVAEEMSWKQVKDEFIAMYVKVFTQEELAGLLTFYRSPAGQAMINKMPALMQEVMAFTQSRMQALMPRIQAMVEDLAKEADEEDAAETDEP
jgi:uncharacterized protein